MINANALYAQIDKELETAIQDIFLKHQKALNITDFVEDIQTICNIHELRKQLAINITNELNFEEEQKHV